MVFFESPSTVQGDSQKFGIFAAPHDVTNCGEFIPRGMQHNLWCGHLPFQMELKVDEHSLSRKIVCEL